MTAQRSDESNRMEIVRDVATLRANVAQAQDQITELFRFHNETSPRVSKLESKGEHMATQLGEHKTTIQAMQDSADSVAASVATMRSVLIWLAGLATIAIGAMVVKWLGA